MQRLLGILIVLAGLGFLTGCGEAKKPGGGASPKDPLDEVGQMLKILANDRRKPPARLAELEAVEPFLPTAGPQIRNGDLVYLWGVEYAAGSTKIVAHEKKTPSEGGWVLLQDGTVKEMTADEFKAAPKAK